MVVRRGKPLKGFGGDSSSSDSDDGFAAMSKKRKRSGSIGIKPSLDSSTAPIQKDEVADTDVNAAKSTLPNTETSSNKRHHHANASRQAKMDALLQELQSTKPTDPSTSREEDHGSIYAHEASYYGDGYDRPPNKMGSYVEAGKEHLTSNMFVGNLHPTTTEEELTDAFRQFGEDRFVCNCYRMGHGVVTCLVLSTNNICEIAYEIFSLNQVISILSK